MYHVLDSKSDDRFPDLFSAFSKVLILFRRNGFAHEAAVLPLGTDPIRFYIPDDHIIIIIIN